MCAIYIRLGVSNRAASVTCTATLKSAKDAGFINDNILITSFTILKKLRETKNYESQVQHTKTIISNALCLMGEETSKTIVFGEGGKLHPMEIKENRCSICSEPGGKYLFCFVNDPEERGDMTPYS